MSKKSNNEASKLDETPSGTAVDAATVGDNVSAGASGYEANPQEKNGSTLPDPKQPAEVGSVADMVAEVATANEGFDPLVHAVNPDGTPKRKVDGSYAMKRGRKSGAAPTTNSPTAQVSQTPTINTDEAARQSCNMLINGAVLLLGEQWEPRDKSEAEGLKTSFKNYFDSRGVPNVPPEVGLAVAVLAYSLPRITHEKTVSRFSQIKIRLYEIWSAIRGK
jgi:hypothetical protein